MDRAIASMLLEQEQARQRGYGRLKLDVGQEVTKQIVGPDGKDYQSMIPKMPAPDLIRGGYRFSEKIMLQQ